MIVQKISDYKVYAELDNKHYIKSGYIGEYSGQINNVIDLKCRISDREGRNNFDISLTKQELFDLCELLNIVTNEIKQHDEND